MKNDVKNSEETTLLKLIQPKSKRILDLGCGLGSQIDYLSKNAFEYFALDPKKDVIDLLKKKYQNRKNLFPEVGYGESLKFKDNYFETVLMIMSFHEIPIQNQYNVLKEIIRVLKQTGDVFIIDPSYSSSPFQSLFDLVHKEYRFFDHKYAVKHSRWVIREALKKKIFRLKKKLIYEVEYLFNNISDLKEYVQKEFQGEIEWNSFSMPLLDKKMKQFLEEQKVDYKKGFILRDYVELNQLINI